MRWIEVTYTERKGKCMNEEFGMIKVHYVLHESRKFLKYIIYHVNSLKQEKVGVRWRKA
jgi:hypothetical protein